jgi:hypothetical protein
MKVRQDSTTSAAEIISACLLDSANPWAVSASRVPTAKHGISFVSASIEIQIHTSPIHSPPLIFSVVTCFACRRRTTRFHRPAPACMAGLPESGSCSPGCYAEFHQQLRNRVLAATGQPNRRGVKLPSACTGLSPSGYKKLTRARIHRAATRTAL